MRCGGWRICLLMPVEGISSTDLQRHLVFKGDTAAPEDAAGGLQCLVVQKDGHEEAAITLAADFKQMSSSGYDLFQVFVLIILPVQRCTIIYSRY